MKRKFHVHHDPVCPYCKDPYVQKSLLATENGFFVVYRHEQMFCSSTDLHLRGGVAIENGVLFEMMK